jgi:hypothetical protein
MKTNYKLELSSASCQTGNDGMLEKWSDGMASCGQLNACGGIKLSIVNETGTPIPHSSYSPHSPYSPYSPYSPKSSLNNRSKQNKITGG